MGLTNTISSSKDEMAKPLSTKVKIVTIIAIFYSSIQTGVAFNTYGPTITSLQHKYGTDDATISKVFTILTGCFCVGALASGMVYDYVNRQLAVATILCVMATTAFLTPHCPTLTTYFISAAIMGLCVGAGDTAWFVWVMEMMQKDCPPYVQAQHFFYGLGVTFSGLIMAPFVKEKEELDLGGNTNVSISNVTLSGGVTFRNDELDYYSSLQKDKLFIPYTIIGLMMLVAAAIHTFLFIFFRYHAPPPEITVELPEAIGRKKSILEKVLGIDQDEPFIGKWSFPKLRLVILSCCFCGAYQGMEMCTFQFFSKFAQNSELQLPETEAAYVLTGMTASYAAGRGAAIIAVFKIPLLSIICANVILIFIADTLLFGWATGSLPVLWASSILFGLGFSSLYASYCAYVDRFLYFTNFIGSLMLVSGSVTAAIYPLVVGSFIEENPIVLSYTSFFSIALLVMSLGSVAYLTHSNKKRY